jgi:hypothetical protein
MDSAMRSGSAKQKRRTKNRISAGEALRAVIVSTALAGILFLAFFVTAGSYFSAERQARNAVSKVTPLSQSAGGEAAHRVASIVVETDRKGRCEERSFDNRTGRIVSSNFVDCEARLASERDMTPSENLSAERMRAILGAFKK